MAQPETPPPIESASDPIHSAADLCQRWCALMGPLGFGERLLRFAFVGPDRRLLKILSEVPIRLRPEPRFAENLMSVLRALLADLPAGTTVAFLLTRPGRGPVSPADRGWSSLLINTAARSGIPLEPIFRANDDSLQLIAPEIRTAQ